MNMHQKWDNLHRSHPWGRWPDQNLVRFVSRFMQNWKGPHRPTALELGCGAGANVRLLQDLLIPVTGIDFSAHAIEQCRDEHIGRFIVGDLLQELPKLPANSFDLVIDVSCLQHLTANETRQALAESARVMRPNGYLFSIALRVGSSPSVRNRMPTRAMAKFEIPQLYGDSFNIETQESAEYTDDNEGIKVRHLILIGRKLEEGQKYKARRPGKYGKS